MEKVEMVVSGAKALVDADQVKLHEKKVKLIAQARDLKVELDQLMVAMEPSNAKRVELDKKIGEIYRLNKKLRPVTYL